MTLTGYITLLSHDEDYQACSFSLKTAKRAYGSQIVKLYERCLISCANYPEFWMRYVDFMESKGGKEIANDALVRATNTFLKV